MAGRSNSSFGGRGSQDTTGERARNAARWVRCLGRTIHLSEEYEAWGRTGLTVGVARTDRLVKAAKPAGCETVAKREFENSTAFMVSRTINANDVGAGDGRRMKSLVVAVKHTLDAE
jgi:hypothetical protein